jgi:hypothetical protein
MFYFLLITALMAALGSVLEPKIIGSILFLIAVVVFYYTDYEAIKLWLSFEMSGWIKSIVSILIFCLLFSIFRMLLKRVLTYLHNTET